MSEGFVSGGPPINICEKKFTISESTVLKLNHKKEIETIAKNSIVILICVFIVSVIIIGFLLLSGAITANIFICGIIIVVFLVYMCYTIYIYNLDSLIENYDKIIDSMTIVEDKKDT